MKPTLQTIMQSAYKEFEESNSLPAHVRKAAWAIINCRTEQMGGYIEKCPDEHFERIWYHSCRHRSCSICSYMQIENWLVKQKSQILDCIHYHAIFTMPDSLNEVWLLNVKLINDTLLKCSKDSLIELLGDKKYMGAIPGLKASIQSWTNDLLLHPHTHFIVTGGGLTDNGKWMKPKRECLLPRKVLMSLFRGKMRAMLISLLEKGKLKLPEGLSKQKFINLMNKLGRKRWNVKIRPPYKYADGVIKYLGRYIKGGPISNSRIISFNDGMVTFKCRGTKAQPTRESVTLSIKDFIRRIILHIPIPGARNVRSYGLYASSKKKELEQSRRLIGQKPPDKVERIKWQEIIKKFTNKDPERCPICNKILVKTLISNLCHAP